MGEDRELLIHRWVTGAFATPEDQRLALLAADIPCAENCRYLAIVVRVDEYRRQLNRLSMEQMYHAKRELLNLCAKTFEHAYCCLGSEAYVVVVLVREDFVNPISLFAPIEKLRAAMEKDFGLNLTIGVGTHAISPLDVPESLRNAHIATRYRMVFGPGQDILYESIAMRVGATPPYPEDEHHAVIDAFSRADTAEFERRLSLFFSAVYTQSVQFGQAAAVHLLMELYRAMPPILQAECDLIGSYTALGECDHYGQQLRVVHGFGIAGMERGARRGTLDRHKEQMEAILAYLALNFTNPDLSINAIAEHVKLSTNTVRVLFRENGLGSPKDYLLNLRMATACRLLRETELTAREISEKVGFTESRYFYAVFKKHTGKTAFEYRAGIGAKQRAPVPAKDGSE